VIESTAQYWKSIWPEREPHFQELHLAQAQSNRASHGRKDDFRDTKRRARRLSVISDLLGASGRPILKASSEGETDPTLAEWGGREVEVQP
jgi:hypothetical protein